jgi:hypothetical protein
MAGSKQSTSPDWERAFTIASNFAKSVQLPFLIPSIVCSAFSVELFIKSLIILEKGNPPRTHQLSALYSCLSSASREAIAKFFAESITANPNARAMKAQFPDVSLKIDDVLITVDKVFEQWRYAYEGQPGSAYGLGELAQAVCKRITELRGAA